MNNSQLNHFSRTPVDLDISRSKFPRPQRRLTTFTSGRLIPLYCQEVIPGDSVKMDLSLLVRMATPIHPTLDNLFLDVHFYFVPNRLVWSHWKQFMGENSGSYWAPSVTYTIPQITNPIEGGDGDTSSSVKGFATGTIGDYLFYPVKREFSVSVLPIRGYCLIWNNFYRDQNTMTPCNISLGDSTVVGKNTGIKRNLNTQTPASEYDLYINGGNYVTNAERGGAPLPVCRLHDLYSSALPSPQKGPSVLLPLGSSAPVKNSTTAQLFSPEWYNSVGADPYDGHNALLSMKGGNGTQMYEDSTSGTSPVGAFVRLEADLSNATAASVNALRNAFMMQRFYERLARGGSRYFEVIRSFFGVTVPDSTVQIPEFLGGRRVPINMTQVAQTSSTDAVSPQGNVSAYSLTTDNHHIFTKSFTEHGYLFAVGCVRAEHSYSQGIPRHLSRKVFSDFYFPVFANAPEQPIYKKELFCGTAADDEVFGYQEAWAEYRYSPAEITGEFRPDYAQSLDSWHYGDDYSSAPSLSAGWMREPSTLIGRTLAVQTHDQFLGDFLFNAEWVRPMPVYSVPGLLDHH